MEQRSIQRLIDRFNIDETLWRKLTVKRCLRRVSDRRLNSRRDQILDWLDELEARPLQEAIGFSRNDKIGSNREVSR